MALRKRSLPSLPSRAMGSGPPSVDTARDALGGRVESAPSARSGVLATWQDARGRAVEGVVVTETAHDLDVWIGEGRMQRLSLDRVVRDRVVFRPTAIDHELADVAADARLFESLREGQRVRFLASDGQSHEGILAERCRYGALVSSASRLFAVSFRRLWPADAPKA